MESQNVYSEKVMEHFRNPAYLGKPKRIDGHGRIGNIACGDVTDVYIQVEDNKLADVKFETLGCASAISTADVLCKLTIGKTIEEAIDFSSKAVIEYLGDLPESKHHCSLLAEEALHEAIYDYLKKNGKSIPTKLEEHHNKALKEKKEFDKKFTKEFREKFDCVCDDE